MSLGAQQVMPSGRATEILGSRMNSNEEGVLLQSPRHEIPLLLVKEIPQEIVESTNPESHRPLGAPHVGTPAERNYHAENDAQVYSGNCVH